MYQIKNFTRLPKKAPTSLYVQVPTKLKKKKTRKLSEVLKEEYMYECTKVCEHHYERPN